VQLQALVDALKAALLERSVLHADETPVAMLVPGKGKTHRAYIWSYSSTAFDSLRAVVYDFADSRAGATSSSASPIIRSIVSRSCCHGTSQARSTCNCAGPRSTQRRWRAACTGEHPPTLQRKPGETLQQLLQRLDAAIDLAWTTEQFIDEINTPLPGATSPLRLRVKTLLPRRIPLSRLTPLSECAPTGRTTKKPA
jgi:hypothetical protein